MRKRKVETMQAVEPMDSRNVSTPVPTILTAQGIRLNPEYLRRLAAEHHEELARLAENDGPALQNEDSTLR